jgi:hypothetical protein
MGIFTKYIKKNKNQNRKYHVSNQIWQSSPPPHPGNTVLSSVTVDHTISVNNDKNIANQDFNEPRSRTSF